MLLSFPMFSGEFRDRQVAAGNPGESGISDAVTFYAKSRYVLHKPDGTTALELTNKRARFVLSLPRSVVNNISGGDVVMITASPSSLSVERVEVMYKTSSEIGGFTQAQTVWDSAEDGAIKLEEVTYWKKSANARVESSQS